jgi:predicted anti-sigma-YlaC factor YlaD
MRKPECTAVRKALSAATPVSGQERHLFTCPSCRALVRIGLAWKSLPQREALEAPEPVNEVFVQRVVVAARRDRRLRMRRRVSLAAAAALVFFFFAGAGQRVASAAAAGAEDAYAQLVGASSLDSLLPE